MTSGPFLYVRGLALWLGTMYHLEAVYMIERTIDVCARIFFTVMLGSTLFAALCFFYFGIVRAYG